MKHQKSSMIINYCQLTPKINDGDQEYPTTNQHEPVTWFLITSCPVYGFCARGKC